MAASDPNALIRLRNGSEQPASAVATTFIALKRLEGGDVMDVIALYEARELARDPGHALFGGTGERLAAFGLIQDGRMHELTRAVVLSAVEGDLDVHLVGPVASKGRLTMWQQGDQCRVVEHDDATREPRQGGEVYPATVERAGGIYVQARSSNGALIAFYQGSGWAAWDGSFRWRLMPAPEPETTAPIAGED